MARTFMMTSTKCTTASAVTNTSGQLQVPIALAFWEVVILCREKYPGYYGGSMD